ILRCSNRRCAAPPPTSAASAAATRSPPRARGCSRPGSPTPTPTASIPPSARHRRRNARGDRREHRRRTDRRARAPHGLTRAPGLRFFFFSFFFRSFSFCERKRTKKKAQEPAWVGPLHSPVSGVCLPRKNNFAGLFKEKPRRKKQQ